MEKEQRIWLDSDVRSAFKESTQIGKMWILATNTVRVSSILLVCNARHELEPILCREIPNGDERPEWCPIKGEVEYARMVHERIVDEIKDNVSMKRLEEELFVLCKEK